MKYNQTIIPKKEEENYEHEINWKLKICYLDVGTT